MLCVAFNPELPLYATSAFRHGAGAVASGERFDWREKGVAEIDALALFGSGLLTHQNPNPAPAGGTAPTKPQARAQRR